MDMFYSHEQLIETLVEYAESSEFESKVEDVTHRGSGRNPLCGDQIQMELQIERGIVKNVSCQRTGCIISRGSAALICERIQGTAVQLILESAFVRTTGFEVTGFSAHRQICARLAYDVVISALGDA